MVTFSSPSPRPLPSASSTSPWSEDPDRSGCLLGPGNKALGVALGLDGDVFVVHRETGVIRVNPVSGVQSVSCGAPDGAVSIARGCAGRSMALQLVALYDRPSAVCVDYGPEFTAQPFVDWCAEHGVATYYIQPGKLDQNADIERFNRSYSDRGAQRHLCRRAPAPQLIRPDRYRTEARFHDDITDTTPVMTSLAPAARARQARRELHKVSNTVPADAAP